MSLCTGTDNQKQRNKITHAPEGWNTETWPS